MVFIFSCFAVYVLANNTRVVPYFIVVYGPLSKYGTTRVLSASTYTAKQLKTIYYSLICYSILSYNFAHVCILDNIRQHFV